MIPRPSLLLRRSSLSEYRPSPASDSFKSSQEDSGLELSEVECLLQVDSLKALETGCHSLMEQCDRHEERITTLSHTIQQQVNSWTQALQDLKSIDSRSTELHTATLESLTLTKTSTHGILVGAAEVVMRMREKVNLFAQGMRDAKTCIEGGREKITQLENGMRVEEKTMESIAVYSRLIFWVGTGILSLLVALLAWWYTVRLV